MKLILLGVLSTIAIVAANLARASLAEDPSAVLRDGDSGGDSLGGDASGGNTSTGDSSRDLECKDISKRCMIVKKYPNLCNYKDAISYCAKSCNKCDKCEDSSQK